MVIKRENQLKVMLSDEEVLMLKELADLQGVSVSDRVRQLVREAHKLAEASVKQTLIDAGETERAASVRTSAMRVIGFDNPMVRRVLKEEASKRKPKK